MTALALLVASFAVVFCLGVQQLNVNANRRVLAFFTSLAISAATLIQFKVLPGPTTWLETGAFMLGSALGIVASMAAYPHLVRLLRFRSKLAPAPAPQQPDEHAVTLGETLRLGLQIADYASRSDIESMCVPVRFDDKGVTWYDTAKVDDDEYTRTYVHNACAFLHLRRKLIRHPAHAHLVRFSR
jgi:hypothetical protein